MPEAAIVSSNKSLSLQVFNGREDIRPSLSLTGDLRRCMRYKFQKSQLPVRCQRPSPYYRPARCPFKLPGLSAISRSSASIATTKSCPENYSATYSSHSSPILRAIGTPRIKKSISMIDLSPATVESDNGDLRSESSSTLGRHEEVSDRVKEFLAAGIGSPVQKTWPKSLSPVDIDSADTYLSQNPQKAASILCHVLILNAWRRRRADVVQLQEAIDTLVQQIQHLRIQIVVLRRLLDKENGRSTKLSEDNHRAKLQLDEVSQERDTLKSEKEKLEEEIKRLSDLSEERSVRVENLKNQLLSAQSQLQSLDTQIGRDREKLLKLREDKKILLDKVSVNEALATERGNRLERAESAIEDLQLRLAAQVALVESAQEQTQRYVRELKNKEEEKVKLERRLRSSEEAELIANMRAENLESQLAEKEADLKRVVSAYNLQLTELNELRDRLIRQSQESGWSSRMLQLAGTVVRAPRAFLRTLSFLSTSSTAP